MYTFIRDITFKTMADAVRGAPIVANIVKYYKDTQKVELRVMRPICGSPIRLRFVSEMESMDAYRAMQVQAIQDPAFQQLLAEIGPTLDGGKTYDEIWQ